MITLLIAWLVALIFMFDSEKATNDSIQLSSSNAVVGSVRKANSSASNYNPSFYSFGNPYRVASSQQYELQLEVLKTQPVVLDWTGDAAQLNRGDIISVTVPQESLRGATTASAVSLPNTLNYLNNLSGTPPFGGYRNRVEIVQSKNENLLYETTKIRLAAMAKNGDLRVRNLYEVHDGEDEEAGVCVNGYCSNPASNSLSSLFNIIQNANDVKTSYNGPKTIEEVVANYEESDFVRNMMLTAKKGYRAESRNKGRLIRSTWVNADRKSSSIRSCYNGVKELLEKAGATSSRLVGEHAMYAGSSLKSQGFLNLMDTDFKDQIKSPYDAPVGSVIVYKTTDGSRSGHIEVRTENGFVSDYFSERARTGSSGVGLSSKGRKVIGVYIKETREVKKYLAYQEFLKEGGMRGI